LKLLLTVVVRDEADVVDAHIAFHLNAGVDFVIAADHESKDGTTEILESYVRGGYLHRISQRDERRDAEWRAEMARLAVDEHRADWVVDSEADEFWMPRGESLKDVLVAIPPRYGLVQALVRVFLPRPDDGRPFFERMTVRRAPYSTDEESMGRLDWALRPVFRAGSEMAVGAEREAALDGLVPLRAWYPIEVLRFPVRSLEQAELRARGRSGPPEPRSRIERDAAAAYERGCLAEHWAEIAVGDDALAREIAAGSLVADDRIRDALRRIQSAASVDDAPAGRFLLPVGGAGHLAVRVPTVVDDVAYAGECAAVREVDFEPLRGRIAQLEERIASLESRFWPRVSRRLSRLVRR